MSYFWLGIDADPEEWRGVVGFEQQYEVSRDGRVRALARSVNSSRGTRWHKGGIMSPVIDKDGYPRVILRVNGKHYTRKVHRLVCEAFNGPPGVLHGHVDHIDGDRGNARASNLRWVSHGENMHFRHRKTGAQGEKNGNAILTPEAVLEIRKRSMPVAVLAQKYGVSEYAIYDVLRGKRWSHVADASSPAVSTKGFDPARDDAPRITHDWAASATKHPCKHYQRIPVWFAFSRTYGAQCVECGDIERPSPSEWR